MKILISEPLGESEYKLVAETSDPDVIEETLFVCEWESLTGLRVEHDDLNWIELSGSKHDGFSMSYSEEGNQWMTKEAPESLEQSITAVMSFATNGSEWKGLFQWEACKQAGAKPAGCASVLVMLFMLTSAITFGTYYTIH